MKCPDCSALLRDNAIQCACGWSFKETPPPTPCAHEGCGFHAIAKVKTVTGWAAFCSKHYQNHFHVIAVKNCKSMGLGSTGDCRRWFKENGLKLKRFVA
jgi:hypothetical protein